MADVELVIKIPEEAYKLLKDKCVDRLGAEHILNAVAKGTPLPKGHGKLFDADSLIKAIEAKAKRLRNADTINGLCGAVNLVFDEQAVIEADKESKE